MTLRSKRLYPSSHKESAVPTAVLRSKVIGSLILHTKKEGIFGIKTSSFLSFSRAVMLIVPHSASTFIDAANQNSIGIFITAALSEAEALTSHLSGSIAPGQETFDFSFPSLRGLTSFPCNEIIGVVV